MTDLGSHLGQEAPEPCPLSHISIRHAHHHVMMLYLHFRLFQAKGGKQVCGSIWLQRGAQKGFSFLFQKGKMHETYPKGAVACGVLAKRTVGIVGFPLEPAAPAAMRLGSETDEQADDMLVPVPNAGASVNCFKRPTCRRDSAGLPRPSQYQHLLSVESENSGMQMRCR